MRVYAGERFPVTVIVQFSPRVFALIWAVIAIAFAVAGVWIPAVVIAGLFAWVLLVKTIQKRRSANRNAKPWQGGRG
jgi:Flp pilus assembly protein TadB